MNHHLLFISLSCLSILYLSNPWISIFIIMISFTYYVFHYQHHRILFLSLLLHMLSLTMLHTKPEQPTSKTVMITQIKASYMIGKVDDQSVLLYDVTNANFGDVIEVEGDYEEIVGVRNEGEFYFPEWASRKGIYYAMNVSQSKLITEGSSLRHHLFAYIGTFDEPIKIWLKLILFGIKTEDNIYFMAVSSGMHIQFMMNLMYSIGTLFLSVTTTSMMIIFLICIIGFATNFSASLVRIICSRLLYMFMPKLSIKDRLGLEILLLITLFPPFIYEIGFLLPIAFRFFHIFNIHHIKRWILSMIILLPFQFWFYQYVDILQLFLFSIMRYVYGIFYIGTWIFLCFPFLSGVLLLIIQVHQGISQIMDHNFKWYYLPNFLWLSLWFYYGLRYIDTNEKKLTRNLILLLLYTQCSPYLNPFLKIVMIDVGQGDCTLFILPFHQGAMLLDVAGNLYKNIPEDILVPMLKKRGIHLLDQVILTHDDLDHSGGLDQLQELMEVKEVINEKQESIPFGPLRFFVPLHDKVYETSNDNSILLFLQLYDITMLFMGDSGHLSEEDVLKGYPNLKIDILKLGHHGSKHSSSPSFIHQLNPTLALISSGRNNRYGHPDPIVLETLQKEEVYPLTTAIQGSSTLYFSKFISFYKTADGEFGIIKHR